MCLWAIQQLVERRNTLHLSDSVGLCLRFDCKVNSDTRASHRNSGIKQKRVQCPLRMINYFVDLLIRKETKEKN